jgi:outer membrane protein OmpA-like peptidoglycan-associated protein
MKCLYILLLNSIFPFLLPAQNLVINGSFEDANICSEIHQFCSPSAWFYIKNNPKGFGLNPVVLPSDGKAVLQLYAVDAITGNRTYWQTMLLCPLVKGGKYEIRVDITAAREGPNLNDIGFYFTDHFLFAHGDTIMQPARYVSLIGAKVKRLKNGWFRVKKEFIAEENVQFMVIGNFVSESNRDIQAKRNTMGSLSVFIDDLAIVPGGKFRCAENNHLIDSLYALHDRHSHYVPTQPDTIATSAMLENPELKTDTLTLRNILFDFDKSIIKNPEIFDQYGTLFKDSTVTMIVVAGYTDDAGTEAYNLQLSNQRAAAVASLISDKFLVPSSRIESTGRGISRQYPDKKLNRRVEIYIYRKSE